MPAPNWFPRLLDTAPNWAARFIDLTESDTSGLLDAPTLAEYLAETTAADRAQAVLDALTDPVTLAVYDSSGALKGSGTMATPWATRSGGVLTVGELTTFAVSASGTPDGSWFLRLESGTRWVRSSFGLVGSGAAGTWSLPTWAVGQGATLGTGTIGTPTEGTAPSLASAPATLSYTQGVGGTYDFSDDLVDPDGGPWAYALIGTQYSGVTIGASTGVLTVTTAAAAAVRNLTVRVTDSTGLTTDHACAVTVQAVASQTPNYADPLDGITLAGGRTTVYAAPGSQGTGDGSSAANAKALSNALAAAIAGQTIQLVAGTYSGNFTLDKSTAANNPVIVKGAANFGSVATGAWTMLGAQQIVTAVDFSAAGARIFLGGVNNHVVGNKIQLWTVQGVIATRQVVGESHGEIAYNQIGPTGSGDGVVYRWGIKGNNTSDELTVHKHLWAHHNWFKDYNVGTTDTRGDAMEAGESGNLTWASSIVAGWYVEDNVITNAQLAADALFDMKYGGCVVRRNTVDGPSSNVKIQARMGTGTILESNYMASGTIQVNGKGHKIVGNYGAVRVLAGEDEWTDLSNLHHRSVDTLVAKNIGSLTVGYQPSAAYSLPATGTMIEEHTGSITLDPDGQTGTIDNRNSPSSYICAPAVQKTSADVGPAALAAASAAYRAARGL